MHFSVLDGENVRVIEWIAAPDGPRTETSVGMLSPPSCTANGKAILAFGTVDQVTTVRRAGHKARTRHSVVEQTQFLRELQETARCGFSINRQEAKIGVSTFRAPVLLRGRALAGVSIATFMHKVDHVQLAPTLQQACRRISKAIEADPFFAPRP